MARMPLPRTWRLQFFATSSGPDKYQTQIAPRLHNTANGRSEAQKRILAKEASV